MNVMHMKLIISSIIFLILTSLFSLAYCIEQGRKSMAAGGYFTDQELKELPDIIELRTRYYLFERTDKYKKMMAPYLEKYGFGYGTIHHYGVGQIYLNRVNSNVLLKPQRKNYLINRAISEFGFVLDPAKLPRYNKRFNQTFLPIVYSKRGEAYLMLNNSSKALDDLRRAIKYKPSYYYAYVLMSQCYRSVGDVQNAEKILELGNSRKQK